MIKQVPNFFLIALPILFINFKIALAQNCTIPTCNLDDCGDVFASYAPSGANVFCEGETITLNNTTNVNDGIEEFQIYWGDESPIQTVNNYNPVSHTYNYDDIDPCTVPNGSLSQFICYVGSKLCTSGQSCNWASTVITVKLKPKANFNVAQQVCISNAVSFSNQSCNEDTYLWNFGDGQTATIENPSHTYSLPGNYAVCLTVTNECGSDNYCQNVQVVPEPIAAFVQTPPSSIICVLDEVTFDSNANYPHVTTAWNINNPSGWDFSDPDNMNNQSEVITVVFTQVGTYNVTLNASNACNNDVETAIITVLANPTVNIPNIPDQCNVNYVYTPTITVSGADAGAVTSWQFPGGTPSNGTGNSPGQVTYSGAGTYTITASVEGACGTASDTETFTLVDPNGNNSFDDLTFCINASSFNLDNNVMNGNWNGTGVNGSDVFNPNSAGVGTHILTLTQSIGGCSVVSQLSVTVLPLPTVNAGIDQTFCLQDTTLTLTATPLGGVWSGNGILPNGTFNPQQIGVGSFTFNYTYTNADNCSLSDNVEINIQDVNVNIDGNETTFCNGATNVLLIATPIGGTWSGNSVTENGIFNPTAAGIGSYNLVYQYSDGLNCTDNDTLSVSVIEAGQVAAGADEIICQNEGNLILSGFSPVGGTWSGEGVSGNDFNPLLTTVGTHEIVYSVGSGTCEVSDTKTITVLPVPDVVAGNDIAICLNEGGISLNGTPIGGTWSGNDLSASGWFTPNSAGTFNLSYQYTNTEGCTDSSALSAYVEGIPPFSFAVNDTACAGSPLIFNIAGGSSTTCFWDFGDGVTSNICNQVYAYETSGTYNISLTVETPLGCTDAINQNIFITAPPIAQFTHNVANNDFICTPLQVTIDNQSNVFGTDATFIFDWGNGDEPFVSNNPDTLVQYTYEGEYILSDTTFYITLTVINPCGTTTYMDSIKVAPTPQVLFGPLSDYTCSETPVLFNPIITGNPNSYTIDWGDGSPIFSGTQTDTLSHTFYTYENDTIYNVCITASNQCGTDMQCWDIAVHPNTILSFFYTDTLSGCAPLAVNFIDISTDATLSPEWNFGDNNVAIGDTVTHTFGEAGTYTVYNYAGNGCAFDTSSVTITVLPAPIVTINVAPIACVGSLVEFSLASPSPLTSVVWDFGDGSLPNNDTAPTHFYQQSGTYTVSLSVVSSSNQCLSMQNTNIEIIDKPEASFSGIFTGCSPFSFSPQNTSTGSTYQNWQFGDGNASIQANPEHLYITTQDTIFSAMLISYNDLGCADTAYNNINIYAQPIAAFSVSDSTHCQTPTTVTFNNLSQNAIGANWYFGDGQTDTNNNPIHNYETVGNYEAWLVAENLYGCKDTAKYHILVVEQPIADILIPPGLTCAPNGLTPINNSINASEYFWTSSNGEIDTSFQPSFYYQSADNYTISLIATNQHICPDTASATLIINPSPTADFSYTELSNTTQFEDLSSNDVVQWHWNFSGRDTSNLQNPTYRFLDKNNQNITLMVSNNIGCSDTITKLIIVQLTPSLYIPNAFAPDQLLGEASLFLPKGVCLQTYHIWIYDKWGALLWESEALNNGQPAEGWDGMRNGKPVQQGSYVWKAEATFQNGKIWEGKQYKNTQKRTGTVTLIR